MNRPFNSQLLWTTPDVNVNATDWIFMFNNWNLDNGSTVRVIWSNHDDIWSIDFSTYDTPLEDWWWVLWKYYRQKTIVLLLSIRADSQESLNNLIDEIKYQTSQTEWKLKIIINWIVRERTATCTSLKFNRQSFNVNRCWNIVLTFTCVNPHSQLETPYWENITWETWTYNWSVIYTWRAETFWKLYLTVDSWNSTWMSFTLNWYTISITASLTAWDIIIFDWDAKTVSVNWIEVKYSWPFTPLTYWENLFSIVNSWTYTWTFSYFIKYL